jgi:serine/threonine protein kinase
MSDRSAESIFHEARRLPPDERVAFVERACAADASLLRLVEGLLEANDEAGSFMEMATAEHAGPADATATHRPGETIGRYKLLQVIGEGGFGEVWMADQREPVKRRVALKVIKLGMDTKQVIARFEAERQALAMMDHPNIARVFDAGTTDEGRPFFVMEYIRGVPLLDYCDGEKLDTRARLELFRTVCHAIQHAHQKSVIHRDIKPSNVLITLHDGVPVPKVIDFGIAKATNQELTERTLFTLHRQMIGTPAYMSPEQAEMSGLDIDTRSDVYSLGVLLYELLTGTTPLGTDELMTKGFAEMMRMIKEVEPQKPSTRLNTLGALGSDTAQRRRASTPEQLGSLLEGDLDWIVMKCLEKDRTRRYPSANGLSEDVHRYLRDEPVTATPPSATYQVRKFVKRHKGACAAAAAVLAALVVGVIGTSVGLASAVAAQGREAQQRNIVEQRFESALRYVQTVSDDVLPHVLPLAGATGAFSGLMDATTEFLGRLSVGQDDSPELRWLTASVVGALAASQGNPYSPNTLGDYEQSLASAQRALEMLSTVEIAYPTLTEHIQLELTLRDRVATAQALMGDGEGALETYLDLETYVGELVGAASRMPEVSDAGAALLAGARGLINMRIGNAQMQLGALDAAHERYAGACRQGIERGLDPDTRDPDLAHRFSVCLQNLATVLGRLERYGESVPLAEQNLEVVRFETGRWPERTRFARDEVEALGTLAIQLALVGRFSDAETLVEEGLPLAEAIVAADPLNRAVMVVALQSTAAFGHALLLAAQADDIDVVERRRLAQRAVDLLGRARRQLDESGGVGRAETFFYDLLPGKLDRHMETARALLGSAPASPSG